MLLANLVAFHASRAHLWRAAERVDDAIDLRQVALHTLVDVELYVAGVGRVDGPIEAGGRASADEELIGGRVVPGVELDGRSRRHAGCESGHEQRQAYEHDGQDDLGKEALDVALDAMEALEEERVELLGDVERATGDTHLGVGRVERELLGRQLLARLLGLGALLPLGHCTLASTAEAEQAEPAGGASAVRELVAARLLGQLDEDLLERGVRHGHAVDGERLLRRLERGEAALIGLGRLGAARYRVGHLVADVGHEHGARYELTHERVYGHVLARGQLVFSAAAVAAGGRVAAVAAAALELHGLVERAEASRRRGQLLLAVGVGGQRARARVR